MVGVGLLPVVVTPTICNIGVNRTLVDSEAGLNLLSPEVFRRMQIGERKLTPSALFCGVTDGKTVPLGQIELPVMFGGTYNFCTENITFDMAHFDLAYNAIFGCPALAKFMAAVHYAYNTLKLPCPAGVISFKANVKGSVHYAERLYEAVVTTSSDDVECPKSSAHSSTKQFLSPDSSALTKMVRLGDDPEKTVTIGADLGEK